MYNGIPQTNINACDQTNLDGRHDGSPLARSAGDAATTRGETQEA
jgi:hypothetical protein